MILGRVVSTGAAALLIAAIAPAWQASADPVPFQDPNASGSIAFCDAGGNPIRSGKVGAAPFAATAVSSVAAPEAYRGKLGKASLYVYQPRKDVDPGDWSGKQMTAASTYTNPSYPMAQGTGLDPALVDFVSVYQPRWDGLIQFRMVFTAPYMPIHSRPYPAAVVRVTGDTWTLISGGDAPCNAGRAQSVETSFLPASRLNQPTARSNPGDTVAPSGPAATDGTAAGGAAPSGSGGGASAGGQPTSRPSGSGAGGDASATHPDAAARSSKGHPPTAAVLGVIAGLVALAAAIFVVLRRRARLSAS